MKKLFTVAVLVLSFCALQVMGQTPTEFNNKMIAATQGLATRGTKWGGKMAELSQGSKKFIELKPLRIDLEKYIDEEIAKLKVMKDVKGSQKFREAIISYLQFEKKLIDEAFMPFEKLGPKATEEQIKKATDNLVALAEKEDDYLKKVNEAQKEYANKNNFKVE